MNSPSTQPHARQVGVLIPACNEEACIAPVLEELLATLDPTRYVIAVGVNGSTDRTAEIAARYPVIVAETPQRGYGFGCQSAIEALKRQCPGIEAYVFFAGDGASDPADVPALVAEFERGFVMVLGTRTTSRANWAMMSLPHVLANFTLALWCGLLTRRRFTDLGPHRLISRELFEAIDPCETTFGWTIEAQIAAAMLDAPIKEVPVRERQRLAGQQKVSGVTWRRTLSVGGRIFAAGWRTYSRYSGRRGECRVGRKASLRMPTDAAVATAIAIPQSEART